jgi:hypothetical protein
MNLTESCYRPGGLSLLKRLLDSLLKLLGSLLKLRPLDSLLKPKPAGAAGSGWA